MSEIEIENNANDTGEWSTEGKWAIRICYILHTLLYFPPIWSFNLAAAAVMLLRTLYIPYIATAILAFFYIRMLRSEVISSPEVLLFALMLITNIISFVFLEFGFTAAMGV